MKDYRTASRLAFDRQAAQYDTAAYGRHARALYPLLLKRLAQHSWSRLLDLGCGTGALLSQITARWPQAHYAGLDLSPKMAETARTTLGSRADILLGDAQQLPFDTASFDIVLCNDSFHHYPQPEQVLQEVHRVLKKGGLFLLGDATAPAIIRLPLNLLLPLGQSGDVHLYSAKELKQLLSDVFHAVESRRVSATSLLAWGISA